jgi:hypothetical protein
VAPLRSLYGLYSTWTVSEPPEPSVGIRVRRLLFSEGVAKVNPSSMISIVDELAPVIIVRRRRPGASRRFRLNFTLYILAVSELKTGGRTVLTDPSSLTTSHHRENIAHTVGNFAAYYSNLQASGRC